MKTLFLLSLTLAACRLSAQENPLIRHLPPDACSIYHFNLPVLRTKISLQQLTERIPLPQKNTYNRELAAILREPGRAGVDTTRDIFLTETNGTGRDSLHTTSLLVHLTDSARWSAFLREQEPGLHISVTTAVSRATTVSPTTAAPCFSAGQDKMGATWNDNLAILTFVRHAARTISPAGATFRAIRQSQALLRGFDDSVAIHDPLFLQGLSDDADIHAYTDQGKILFLLLQQLLHLDRAPSYPALTAPGCGKIRTFSALRFEKGRVILKNTLCLPPGADTLYKKLTVRPIPNGLLSQIPPGTILAMLYLHFDPAAIAPLLDGLQARGRSEALLFDKGVSLETFVRGFQGDFLLTAIQPPVSAAQPPAPATQPASPQTPDSPDTTTPKTAHIPPRPALYLATNLLDQSAFWSWASHLKWLNPPADGTSTGRVSARNPLSKRLPAYRIKDSLLVIGSSPKKLAAWFDDSARAAYPPRPTPDSATTPNIDPITLTRFRESPLSGWLDIRALTTSLRQRPAAERDISLLSLLSALDRLTFTAGHLTPGGQLENLTELKLVNSEENSLKILFRLLE